MAEPFKDLEELRSALKSGKTIWSPKTKKEYQKLYMRLRREKSAEQNGKMIAKVLRRKKKESDKIRTLEHKLQRAQQTNGLLQFYLSDLVPSSV